MDIFELIEKDETAARGELTAMGFADPVRALANCRLILDGVTDPLIRAIAPSLLKACAQSADPDTSLNNFERVSSSCGPRESFLSLLSFNPDGVKLLAPLFACSQFLTRTVASDPERLLTWLLASGRLDAPREKEDMHDELLAECPPGTTVAEATVRLRKFKYREFLRITVRDLMGRADVAETTLELSNLADAAMEAALRVAQTDLDNRYGVPLYIGEDGEPKRCPFTIIGMGKLGGRELNFSSDVDLMYIYLSDTSPEDSPQKITNHQYFVRLGEMVGRLIGDKTADGIVFRVDLRLRPEGERGDLAQSLQGYEIYYESWGQTWERSALLKARPCAGDMALGRKFLDMIHPFIFRKYMDYGSIGEIRDMKQRIERAGLSRAAKEIDIKRGFGGIREVEFFISALQLLYGGREPGIREKSTLKALHRLALKGLITFEEQQELSRAYEFFRLAEHRLQVVDERQTHSLARTEKDIDALARRMGFRDQDDKKAGEIFFKKLDTYNRRVRSIYDGLLTENAAPAGEAEEDFDYITSIEATAEEAFDVLERSGFRNPQKAYRNILLLRDGSSSSSITPRARTQFMKILPELLKGCSAAPDPDMALNHLESFITAFGSREAMHDLITQKPHAAGQITRLFGSSEYFSRMLISQPELSDFLLKSNEGLMTTRAGMSVELSRQIAEVERFADKMDILRRFKHEEELRIGIRDIFTNPGYRSVSADLTSLAEVVIEQALKIAEEDMRTKYPMPETPATGIAVAGFGKLGTGELGYGSDLDIIFVYHEPDSAGTGCAIGWQEFYARLSERVIFALSSLTRSGFVFRVDTRLRPGGSKGVLAHTIEGLSRYYGSAASVWELQALTRARAVAGDAKAREAFDALRLNILGKPRDEELIRQEVRSMRERIERELGRPGKGGGIHIKHGRGGFLDIEFIVQYIQLTKGPECPELLNPDTASTLGVIISKGLLKGGDELPGMYAFLKELESRLRITTSQPETLIPDDRVKLEILASRMGYAVHGPEAADRLFNDYSRIAKAVRDIYNRIFN